MSTTEIPEFTIEAINSLLGDVVEGMTYYPNGLESQAREVAGFGVQIVFSVRKSEAGKIVGKQGKNILALRTLFTAIVKRWRPAFGLSLFFDAPTTGNVHDHSELPVAEQRLWDEKEGRTVRSLFYYLTGLEGHIQQRTVGRFVTVLVSASVAAVLPEETREALGHVLSAMANAKGNSIEVVYPD